MRFRPYQSPSAVRRLRVNGFLEDCKLAAAGRFAMTPVAPDVASSQDVPTQIRRDRMVVRRRRSRGPRHNRTDWAARRSFRKVLRAVLACVTVLVVMSLGLYFGLAG